MEYLLWFIFIISSIVLSVVILLQEPKGGGLAEAFGGMGAQTFGVKATGITKFTAYTAIVFLLSGIMLTCHSVKQSTVTLDQPPPQEAPLQPGGMAPQPETAPETDDGK